MLKKKKLFTLSVLIILFGYTQNAHTQTGIKKGFKFGAEFTDYFLTETGSFSKEPGISFGYFTGINLYTNTESAILLGLEFNFTRVIRYRINYDYITAFEYRMNHFIFDQKFRYSFIEIVLTPEYLYVLNDNMSVSLFAGPSIGLGTQYLQNNEVTRIQLEPLNYNGEFYYPYGEYNMDRFKSFACFNLGVKIYYSILVFDLRYRYTYIGNLGEANNIKNVYAQVGLTL